MITNSIAVRVFSKSTAANIQKYVPYWSLYLERYEVNTPVRLAAYFAQIAHETGHLKFIEENLNYSLSGLIVTFPKYFNDINAKFYARKPVQIANRVYANRMGNGDEFSGDGWKFRGRGLIQLTGNENYLNYSLDTYGNDICVKYPDRLAFPEDAVRSSLWFWESNKLNRFADEKDIVGLTKRINGGIHGLANRQALYSENLKIFGV